MKLVIAAVIGLIVLALYCCFVAAGKADEEMERNYRADYGEPEEGKHG